MRKFEDATAKSEDERGMLSCYANSFRIRNFTFSHLQTKGGPRGHHQHLTSYSYSHAKNSATWWRGAKKCWGPFFFFFLVYIQIYWCSYLWICWHMYIHIIKKNYFEKKSWKLFKVFFPYYFAYIFIFGVQVLKILHNLLEINFVNEYIYTANCMFNVFFE